MSIVTNTKQVNSELNSAVEEFLRQASVTVVPARKSKDKSKSAIAARERAINEWVKATEK